MSAYKDDCEKLKKLFDKDDISVPPELEPGEIEAKLFSVKKPGIKRFYKIAAAAAAVCICTVSALTLNNAFVKRGADKDISVPANGGISALSANGYKELISLSDKVSALKGKSKADKIISSPFAPPNTYPGADYYGMNCFSEFEQAGEDENTPPEIMLKSGEYIYSVDQNEKRSVYIIKDDGKKLSEKAAIKLGKKYYVKGIYLSGGRLTVASLYEPGDRGYTDTVVEIYSVENPEKPKLKARYFQDGEYISSREAGGAVYVVTGSRVFQKRNAKNAAWKDLIERCVPGVKKDGAKKLYPTSEKVYIRKDFKLNDSGEYNRLMLMKNLICAYDADAQSDPETAVLVGYQPDVYFKGNNLYLLDYPDRGKTNITKLSTADKKITYKAFGEAEGVPIDNLSAGEYNKTFRLATYTVTQAKNGKLTGCENHISVFDDELKLVSHTSVLKDKYYPSVNFIGDAAYFNVYNAENDYRLYSVSLKNADKGGAAELTGAPLKLDVSYSKMHGAGEHIFAAGVNRDLGVNVALFSKKPDGSLKLIKSERVRDSREWKMLSAATEEITALCRLPGSDSLLIPIVYDDADGFSESAGAVEYSVKDGALKQKGRYYTGRYSAVLKISATNERVYMLDDYGVTAFDAKSRKKLYFESLR